MRYAYLYAVHRNFPSSDSPPLKGNRTRVSGFALASMEISPELLPLSRCMTVAPALPEPSTVESVKSTVVKYSPLVTEYTMLQTPLAGSIHQCGSEARSAIKTGVEPA